MPMHTLTMPYPDDLPAALGVTPEEFERELCVLVAAKLYELGRLTPGQAAALAGLPRVEFLLALGRYQIAVFNYGLDELEQEMQEAQARGSGV